MVVANSIYGNLSVMSRSSYFWELMVSATLMQSKYADTPVMCWRIHACAIACKISISNTSGLYWEFHNIQYRRQAVVKRTIFRVQDAPQFWSVNCLKSVARADMEFLISKLCPPLIGKTFLNFSFFLQFLL
jgi:hypothetical protein